MPLLRETHERVALIIAVCRITAGSNQNAFRFRIRQDSQRGGLEAVFDLGLNHDGQLLFDRLAENLADGIRILGILQRGAKFAVMKLPGDVRQCVEVLLELASRHQK